MKRFSIIISFSVLLLAYASSMAQTTDSAKEVHGKAPYKADSLCAKTDQIVLSCPLARNGKVVSFCAAGSVDAYRFYYTFGRQNSPEMIYPEVSKDSTQKFSKSHLLYAGATGGYAYSFINNEYKYILYRVSGTDFEDGGILIQRVGEPTALKDMKCKRGDVVASPADEVFRATEKLKSDPDLSLHGLPSTK